MTINELAVWIQPLCEKHRRLILGSLRIDREEIDRDYVEKLFTKLGYTLDNRSNTWIL